MGRFGGGVVLLEGVLFGFRLLGLFGGGGCFRGGGAQLVGGWFFGPGELFWLRGVVLPVGDLLSRGSRFAEGGFVWLWGGPFCLGATRWSEG